MKEFSTDLNDYRVGETCGKPAAYRYTWPGKDESVACTDHGAQLQKVASIIGLHLQLVPVSDGTCKQILS